MGTSISSSPSIGKDDVVIEMEENLKCLDSSPNNMEEEMDEEDGPNEASTTDIVGPIVVFDPKDDTSTIGSHVGPLTNPTCTHTPLSDYTEHFTTDKVFSSDEELVEWAKSIGREHRFVIVTKASEKLIKHRSPRIRLACDRSGSYRPYAKKLVGEQVKKRARSTGTKKCQCPFELKAVKGTDGWTVSVSNGTHNHPPAVYFEGHSYPGRFSDEETKILLDLSASLVKPKEILSQLKYRNPSNVSTIKQVYNARQKHKVVERVGRSQMQHLMARLHHYNYVHWHRAKEDGSITDLFWSPPSAGEMLRAFPGVLMMDCTYKTNRYKFPLLQIVGVTSTDLTFSAAFAFMESEKTENYTWVLEKLKGMMDPDVFPVVIVADRELALMNAIGNVFPRATNLLCRWHISKNILAKCRKLFDGKMWEEFTCRWGLLVNSSSVAEYEDRLWAFKRDFRMVPIAIEYVEQNWLTPYKERFVGAWTDKVMHCGNLTSNRAESAHSKLKHHLENSQCNFDNIWEKIHRLIMLQVTEVKASLEKSLSTWQHDYRLTIFDSFRGVVSHTAMALLLAASLQVEWVKGSDCECHCALRHTHGLLCAHEIAPYKTKNIPIPVGLIHNHWKRLSLVPPPPDSSSLEKTVMADFDIFYERFKKENYDVQLHLMKKLKEVIHPDCTTIVEPQQKATTRGRKTAKENKAIKIQNSTRRAPSEFEHIEASLQTPKAVKEKPRCNSNAKRKVAAAQHNLLCPFIDQFPEKLRPFITSVKDVETDGNCGFRAISVFMTEDSSQHEWKKVRNDLLAELNANWNLYDKIGGVTGRAFELPYILSYSQSPAPREKWMTMPDMGHLIASTYNCVLVHLSKEQCLTFFALQSKPLPSMQRKVIAIGFVHRCHFVQVFLKKGSPMPPVACNWKKYHLPIARNWGAAHCAAMRKFDEIIDIGIVTKEVVDIGIDVPTKDLVNIRIDIATNEVVDVI